MRRHVTLALLLLIRPIFAQVAPAEMARVVLPSGTVLEAEVARDDETRARGLMFRDESQFRPGQAMVFLFPGLDAGSFWMKNVNFPIDIVWLSPELQVVHVERSVPPCAKEPCPRYTPMQRAQFVIELHRGTAEREGLKIGDKVALFAADGKSPLAPAME